MKDTIEKYIKNNSAQDEDNLVFPNQDYLTLVMNLTPLLREMREDRDKEVVEIIEEHGHQQDDDTIWCNMDELLKAINLKQ